MDSLGLLLHAIPEDIALEDPAAPQHFGAICDLIAAMTSAGRTKTDAREDPLPSGIGISMATKLTHPKRRRLLPILDNIAIFDHYVGKPKAQEKWGTATKTFIEDALGAIRRDLCDPANQAAWRALLEIEPTWARIEHLDAVWWVAMEPRRVAERAVRDKKPPNREACVRQKGGLCPYACGPMAVPALP
jgi:hypothetical protein